MSASLLESCQILMMFGFCSIVRRDSSFSAVISKTSDPSSPNIKDPGPHVLRLGGDRNMSQIAKYLESLFCRSLRGHKKAPAPPF